ncbi:MAG: dihydrodipicolinate reductase [Chloroflexota bacterium]
MKAVQYGCGPIGCSVVRFAAQRPDVELVGAIDVDKNLVGKDIGEVAGLGKKLGVKITDQAEALLAQTKPDVVFVTTSSAFKKTAAQLEACIKAGANIVSTCEELAYPFKKDPALSAKIDKLAKENKVTVLGTGVNPGFLMDSWPLFMTGVCQKVEKIKAVRIQDASPRRGPFQKKIGAGCTMAEFQKKVDEGTLRHVGLAESIAMVAAGLGWELDDITESIEPIVAKKAVKTEFVDVKPGQAAGVRQVGRGIMKGKEVITMEFEAAVGYSRSYDGVYITGVPNLEVVIEGGTHGDIATAAIVVNSAKRVIEAPPGLLTMKDLPIVSALGSK